MKIKSFLSIFLLVIFFSPIVVIANLSSDITELFSIDEKGAIALDSTDPLQAYKEKFAIPVDDNDNPVVYLNGHVMGLAPFSAREYMLDEIKDWEKLGVKGRYKQKNPWNIYHEKFRSGFAKLLGAHPEEIVLMNTLSTNLHLAMVSFYRPTKDRYKIMIESPVYISDLYVIKSQLKFHGIDPDDGLVIVEKAPDVKELTIDDFVEKFEENKDSIALILVSSVNHLTGQVIDIENLTKLAHNNGAVVGLNLAHSVGNIPLKLHKWDVDFAAWCNYKYMSGGPGVVGGLFVNKIHVKNPELHRFAGWWGSDPKARMSPEKQKNFLPVDSADSWQPSEPPIFSMAPLQASLKLFDEVGIVAYREKSIRLTSYLEYLIDYIDSDIIEIITPRDINKRGCQISLLIKKDSEELFSKLVERGVIADFKKPNVIRVSPMPLYNGFYDVWRFANTLSEVLKGKSLNQIKIEKIS